MGVYQEALKKADLKDGEMKRKVFGKHQILIARSGNAYYATDTRCPHMGADLSTGTLSGAIVTCPKHGSQFDLRDGSVVRWTTWSGLLLKVGKLIKSEKPIKTYPVKVEGDSILVELEP